MHHMPFLGWMSSHEHSLMHSAHSARAFWADGRPEALEAGPGMANPELLAETCGPTARYIKSYQLIGINFLLLLAREGVEGSILADEMGEIHPTPPPTITWISTCTSSLGTHYSLLKVSKKLLRTRFSPL